MPQAVRQYLISPGVLDYGRDTVSVGAGLDSKSRQISVLDRQKPGTMHWPNTKNGWHEVRETVKCERAANIRREQT